MHSSYENLKVTRHDDGVWVVTLARPAKRNALNAETIEELVALFSGARAAGADETLVIDRTAPDFSALKDRVDVVFDPVGGALFTSAVRTLRWNGRYLLIGFAGGIPQPFALNFALIKGIEIVGVRAGEFGRRDPAGGVRVRAEIDALVEPGRYRPLIGMEVPLERADEAFAAMAAGTLIGKAVVRIR